MEDNASSTLEQVRSHFDCEIERVLEAASQDNPAKRKHRAGGVSLVWLMGIPISAAVERASDCRARQSSSERVLMTRWSSAIRIVGTRREVSKK